MPLMELRTEGVWFADQTAKGTVATTADKRGRKSGGDIAVAIAYGNAIYSDGNRYPSTFTFVDTISGEGNPQLHAQVDVIGYLSWLTLGSETVTGSADPWTHTAKPVAGTPGKWFTAWKRVGDSVIQRQRFADCRMSSLRIEASAGAKTCLITPTFTVVDPGEIIAADPAQADSGNAAMLHTESEGLFQIDTVVNRGVASWAVVISDTTTPYYGDSVVPYDVSIGASGITVENLSLPFDSAGLSFYNTKIYGTASPTAGTKPLHSMPATGQFLVDMTKSANREAKITIPAIQWSLPNAPAGNPEGGVAELQLTGAAQNPVSGDIIQVLTKSADPAY